MYGTSGYCKTEKQKKINIWQCHIVYGFVLKIYKESWRERKFIYQTNYLFDIIGQESDNITQLVAPSISPNKSKKLTLFTSPAHTTHGTVRACGLTTFL